MSTVLLVGCFLCAWPAGAHAQLNLLQGYNGPTLDNADFAAGDAAAQKLLTEDQAKVGKSANWAGPTSGNTGNLSIRKAFRRQGLDCRTLRSEVRYKKTSTSSPRVLNLNVCQTTTGEWKLM